MTDSRRQFSTGPAGPAWGQTHLALDAVVAFVDDELSSGARRRALAHLAGCAQCGAEVVAQTQARVALRTSTVPPLSSSLLHSLRAIPNDTELPAAPAGLAMGSDGEFVTMAAQTPRAGRRRGALDRGVRLGAGAVVTGVALSALVISGTPSGTPGAGVSPGAPGSMVDARLRLGGGVRDAADTAIPAVQSGQPSIQPAIGQSAVPRSSKVAQQRWYR